MPGCIASCARASRPTRRSRCSSALNSRLRFWASDEDGARRSAAARLAACLRRLDRDGIWAEGRVGDADRLLAIVDGLRLLAADEIVIVPRAGEHAHWLERRLLERARAVVQAVPIARLEAGEHLADRA